MDRDVSKRMKANRRRDTEYELGVRRAIFHRGLRYRVDFPIKTRNRVVRPDVVFPRLKIAVFLDGCFWHSCPAHGTSPQANYEYWSQKFQRNRERDEADVRSLSSEGWSVKRFWEHSPACEIAHRIVLMVSNRRD